MADETLNARLQRVLVELRPNSVLVVGDSLAPLVETLTGAGETLTRLSSTEAAQRLSALSIHDLALVQADATLTAPESGVLLARLRDVYARKVLVIVALGLADGPWSRRSLIRLGFTPYGAAVGAEDARLLLYQFDIATYKTTPDWLSPNNWANPELWDKHRW
ncbi:MAG: hypothetical protein J5I81_04650 [Nitrococcus mobilis]|nr:hypothetical protein [Nitrococcus mobilis]